MRAENATKVQMRLNQGEACVMSIDRTTDGSYGTVRLQYDNPYIMVFDEYDYIFSNGDYLGLLEVPTNEGWVPRTFMVANAGLMPTQFNAIYEQASLSVLASLTSLATLAALLQ